MDVPAGQLYGSDPKAFLEGACSQIQAKLKEEIQSLYGVKMQLALKVSLRKGQSDCAEKYTDPVLRHKQEVLFQAREINEALDIAFPSILETLEK